VKQADAIDDIGARLHADREGMSRAERLELLYVRRIAADDDAVIGLRELIALRRILEEVREVREQREIGVHSNELNSLRRARADVAVRAGQTVVAADVPPSVESSCPKARDETFFPPRGVESGRSSSTDCDTPIQAARTVTSARPGYSAPVR